jgi:hypothetical protein
LEQRLAHANLSASLDAWSQCEAWWCKDDDGGAVLEPAQLLAFDDGLIARHFIRAWPAEMQQHIEKMESNTRDEDGGYGHECQRRSVWQCHANDGAFIAAKQALHSFESDGVDVPGVAAQVSDVLDGRCAGCMETVIHAGGEPKSDIGAVDERSGPLGIAEEIFDAVREAFGLEDFTGLHATTGSDDAIARAGENLGIAVDGPRTGKQLAGEAVVQAVEALLLRFAEIEVSEHSPDGDGEATNPGIANLAEATHQTGECLPRHAIREEEIEVLLQQEPVPPLSKL